MPLMPCIEFRSRAAARPESSAHRKRSTRTKGPARFLHWHSRKLGSLQNCHALALLLEGCRRRNLRQVRPSGVGLDKFLHGAQGPRCQAPRAADWPSHPAPLPAGKRGAHPRRGGLLQLHDSVISGGNAQGSSHVNSSTNTKWVQEVRVALSPGLVGNISKDIYSIAQLLNQSSDVLPRSR
jgi:hypothetical protein